MLFLAAISLAIVTATSRIGGWLDVMYFFSYVKLYISFAKYLPQARLYSSLSFTRANKLDAGLAQLPTQVDCRVEH